MPWDLLRTFECVVRIGSLTAAARTLGVSQSTVSRQLARLEDEAGSPLLVRETPVRPTERGVAVLAALTPMVEGALAVEAALEATPELMGQVTITTVGEVLRWELVDHLHEFYARHPSLRLRILADNHVNSLAANEADIALRFARPVRGDLVAQRMTVESYALFAAEELDIDPELPWLGLTGSLAQIPEQRHAERLFGNRAPRLLVEDLESLGLAVTAGLGVAILPRGFAVLLEGIVELEPAQLGLDPDEVIPSRELWLIVHRSKQRVPKIRAVIDWLVESVMD